MSNIKNNILSKVPWILDLRLAIAFLLIALVVEVVISIIPILVCNYYEVNAYLSDLINIMMQVIGALITSYVFITKLEHKKFIEMGWSTKGQGSSFLAGGMTALMVYAVGFFILLATNSIFIKGYNTKSYTLITQFLFFIFVALHEEALVRGYILRVLIKNMNKFVALIISSLIFAAMHLLNPNLGVLPMVNLTLAGILLGAAYLYTRNLWFPISLHLFWNYIQGPVLGFEVSGLEIDSCINLGTDKGSTLWNGGTFGFEGSLTCTLLLLLTIGIIIGYYEKKSKKTSASKNNI